MRDIKCRGLTTKGEWVYGSLVVTNAFLKHKQAQHTKNWIVTSAFGNGGWFNIRSRYYVKDDSVGLFTGLQDKNGVDIYEGDILRVMYGWDNEEYQTVVYYNGGALAVDVVGCDYDYIAIGWAFENSDIESFEVIGNDYENKDLLK